MTHKRTASAVFAALAISSAPHAQEAPGDAFGDYTDSAIPEAIHPTRLDYAKTESPEAVTVITREDIQAAGFLDVSEILRAVPGFRIVKTGDESRVSYHGTTVRQNRRMRVTIDGRDVLIGDGQYVEFDRLPITVEDIVRVTVTRGPNGAAYGDNAFLANIDFQTVGHNDPHATAVRAGGGANDRERYGLAMNEALLGVDVSLSLGTERNGGYPYEDAQKKPRDDGKDIKRAQVTFSKAITDRSRWDLNGSAYDSKHVTDLLGMNGKQSNKGSFIALSNQWDIGKESRLDTIISHNEQKEGSRQYGCFSPALVNSWQAATNDTRLLNLFLLPAVAAPLILNASQADTCFYTDLNTQSQRTDAEMQWESRFSSLRYTAGVSGSDIAAQSPQWFNSIDQHQRTYRAFGEAAYGWRDLTISGGGMGQRSDNVDGTEFATRAAINWQFMPQQVVRYAYARSFRVPALVESETHWNTTMCFRRINEPVDSYVFCGTAPIVTNPVRLKPEHIDSHSVGYFGSFPSQGLTVDVKVFRDTLSDPIRANLFFISAPPQNGAAYTLQGVETEWTLRLNTQWKVSGEYSYLDNSATDPFERGMQGLHSGSMSVVYRPSLAHSITVSYYGNSAISGNAYDRYDLTYNYTHRFGPVELSTRLILQHHIGGVDGIHGVSTITPQGTTYLGADEGYFAHLNQFFAYADLRF